MTVLRQPAAGPRGGAVNTRHAERARPFRAFTLIEVMIALFIFALVLMTIYSIWMGIMRGTRSGLKAAASVQRARIAMRSLEDAFLTVEMFSENGKYYYFIADASGDMSAISMVSRLPASFPGVGRYGDQVVRRVSFYTQPGTNGTAELMMSQMPMLLDTNNTGAEAYSLVLARDVSLFTLEFWDKQKEDWTTEWISTNQLPALVRISLGQGKTSGAMSTPQDLVTRIIAIPAAGGVLGAQAAGPLTPQPNDPALNNPALNNPYNNPALNNPYNNPALNNRYNNPALNNPLRR